MVIPNKEIDKALKKVGRLITDGIFVKIKAFYAYGLVFPLLGIDGNVRLCKDTT
jgi:hypothetical protein